MQVYVMSKTENEIFAVQSCEEENIKQIKDSMLLDAKAADKTVEFTVMTEEEYKDLQVI